MSAAPDSVEQLCANMEEAITEISQTLNGLTPELRKTEWADCRADLLEALRALTEMNPEQGRAALALFPELALVADLSADQQGELLKLLADFFQQVRRAGAVPRGDGAATL